MKVVIVSVAVVGTALVGIYLIRKQLSKLKIPTEWVEVGKVKELYIYPLKSGRATDADYLFVTQKGVKEVDKSDNSIELKDRSFIIYTVKDHEVRTARQFPKTVLISIQAAENGVILSAPNKIDLYINVPQVKNNVKIISVWGRTFGDEQFICTDCGNSAAKWISNFLLEKDDGLRLGYGDGSKSRNLLKAHKNWAAYYTKITNNLAGIFSDLASLHLINQSTVDDLNERLVEKVSVKNFRPNVVIEGAKAFAEDQWEYIKIGNVVTKVCLEVLRCTESTVTPNGEMNKHREPLKTLETYRPSDGAFKGAVMGIYLMVLKTGKISNGDVVSVSKS